MSCYLTWPITDPTVGSPLYWIFGKKALSYPLFRRPGSKGIFYTLSRELISYCWPKETDTTHIGARRSSHKSNGNSARWLIMSLLSSTISGDEQKCPEHVSRTLRVSSSTELFANLSTAIDPRNGPLPLPGAECSLWTNERPAWLGDSQLEARMGDTLGPSTIGCTGARRLRKKIFGWLFVRDLTNKTNINIGL